MDYNQEALRVHKENRGKMAIASKVALKTKDDLSIGYTPGVAEPCRQIHKDKNLAYDYTIKGNYIGVVTDGTAVLGLGDIGPEAALPVMEGKCILFKEFGGVDAVPLCVATKDPDEIVDLITKLGPAFGGFNLEDIGAPRCFEIERKLKEKMDIPIFHDDQHGTAVVVLAALINALRVLKKDFADLEVVISGAGAAGISVTWLLKAAGVKNVVLCDTKGAIYLGRKEGMNPEKELMAKETNKNNEKGSLKDVLAGKDVFIGVSGPGTVTQEMIKQMNKDAIVFAMANPIPEIFPEEAKAAGAGIVGTGRSDYPNQINNSLAFPGIFRGALDVRAKDINEEMKIAAARAIADMIPASELSKENLLPKSFDKNVGPRVAAAVAQAAVDSNVARIPSTYDQEYENAKSMIK
ncbi:NAD(P)-dependent malic enzyme [Sporomusa sp.]|uniref:NAD(P)-dependent malic enzyme n=1 Tax=Sporomusa sp. TaxID=2078658 RepID=UPI002BC9591A|nr:malic enzyme-like NAD(P)-binding protein [Sporomusa sp.]HWR45862.1 malic enzyme-like NAD(P)-binding protein [Sporomusa sp.]